MDQQRRPRRPEALGVFGLPLNRLRTILRICHLTFGMLLMPYIYSPSATSPPSSGWCGSRCSR
jgi:hypothetical protein